MSPPHAIHACSVSPISIRQYLALLFFAAARLQPDGHPGAAAHSDVLINHALLPGACVRLLSDVAAFRSSFSHFGSDSVNGLTNDKLARLGCLANITDTFGDYTATCEFWDGTTLDFPIESFESVQPCSRSTEYELAAHLQHVDTQTQAHAHKQGKPAKALLPDTESGMDMVHQELEHRVSSLGTVGQHEDSQLVYEAKVTDPHGQAVQIKFFAYDLASPDAVVEKFCAYHGFQPPEACEAEIMRGIAPDLLQAQLDRLQAQLATVESKENTSSDEAPVEGPTWRPHGAHDTESSHAHMHILDRQCCVTWDSETYLVIHGKGFAFAADGVWACLDDVANRSECWSPRASEMPREGRVTWGPNLDYSNVVILSREPYVVRQPDFLDAATLQALRALPRGERVLPAFDGTPTARLMRKINQQVADLLGIPAENGRFKIVYKDGAGLEDPESDEPISPRVLHHDSKSPAHDMSVLPFRLLLFLALI